MQDPTFVFKFVVAPEVAYYHVAPWPEPCEEWTFTDVLTKLFNGTFKPSILEAAKVTVFFWKKISGLAN